MLKLPMTRIVPVSNAVTILPGGRLAKTERAGVRAVPES
jgi:hypothetical protein